MAKKTQLKTEAERVVGASKPAAIAALFMPGGSHADKRGKRGKGNGSKGSRKGQRRAQDRRAMQE